VDEDALPPRIHHFFVVRLLFKRENVAGEKLERAIEIGFERADRPRASACRRRVAIAVCGHVPVELGRLAGGAGDSQLRPGASLATELVEHHRVA
jgi:hypothetical protein